MPRIKRYSEQLPEEESRLGRPSKRQVPRRQQEALQEHVRLGLKLLGITQSELRREYGTLPEKPTWREREVAEQARRSDYRWVRKHLSRTDPHFTYDVARKLFEMVAEHPEVGKLSPVRHGQWSQWLHDAQATAAFDLDEAQNQGELFAFVPVVQQQRFAEAIVELLERDGTENGKRPFSRSRKSLIAKTIELWLRREGGRMAYHLGTIYPRRIVNNFPKINEKQCHEVFMAAHDTAFIIERGLLKSKAKRATTRNVKN